MKMENKIRIRSDQKTFILYHNEVKENYGHLCIDRAYDIRQLAEDANEVQWLVENNYYIEVNDEKQPPSIKYLTKEAKRRVKEGLEIFHFYNIFLSKDIRMEDVQSYYDFCLEIEINNIRLKCDCSNAYADAVYVSGYSNRELKENLTNLLGEPEIVPEQEHEKFVSPSYYIVPVSKIDKIIGIKKYRDKRTIEEFGSPIYINEGKEIVLDLENFDMSIYKIFEEHGMLNMYDDEKLEPKYKYENRIIIKPPKSPSPQPPGKLSRMLTYIIKKIICRWKWSENN